MVAHRAGYVWLSCLVFVETSYALSFTRRSRSDPYAQVTAQAVVSSVPSTAVATSSADPTSSKYLIASFPHMKQVGYISLPDNVWRPLVIGDVKTPTTVAVDTQNARLFVADPGSKVIWWYQLFKSSDGLLQTDGIQKAAVEGVVPLGLTLNSVGDLYFTGHLTTSSTNYSSVFRQDAANIAKGYSMTAVEVYTRSNTGSPDPKVWAPSGIAVDSLFVYWGNKESATEHGSVVKGSRQNIGLLPQETELETLSYACDEVRGLAATGTHIFYLSPEGVHGVLKSVASPVTDPSLGLIAMTPTTLSGSGAWSPTSIAWDGDNTLYFTDSLHGVLYTLPALNVEVHTPIKFADAPGVHGVALIGFTSGGCLRSSFGFLVLLAVTVAGSLSMA